MQSEIKETENCPYCLELILKGAQKCKHCGEWLIKPPALPTLPVPPTPPVIPTPLVVPITPPVKTYNNIVSSAITWTNISKYATISMIIISLLSISLADTDLAGIWYLLIFPPTIISLIGYYFIGRFFYNYIKWSIVPMIIFILSIITPLIFTIDYIYIIILTSLYEIILGILLLCQSKDISIIYEHGRDFGITLIGISLFRFALTFNINIDESILNVIIFTLITSILFLINLFVLMTYIKSFNSSNELNTNDNNSGNIE